MECHGGRAAEGAQTCPGNPLEPSRAANAPSQDGEPRSDCEEEPTAEIPDTSRTKGSDAKRGFGANRLAEESLLQFHIPRRNKEKRALFQSLSSESREFAEILSIITSSYKDPASKVNFVYSNPRLVYNELLEKEFIEKRKELKQDGRTEKELAESYCFLLSDKVPLVCKNGALVGSSWMSLLGHTTKGIYLCQFSDLLLTSALEPGYTGELIIFKVIKGRAKSIHDNMLRGLDPTPKFDSHFSKNANKVTSLTTYKAFDYTQQYFYEYVNFEPSSRPRHVCPHAVVSFQFKAKEATTAGPKTSTLQRSNSMPSGTERCGYTVWKGHFVNKGKEVYQASLHSISQPFLPFKIPDRMEMDKVMRLEQVKSVIPSSLFSWDLYSGSHEVFKSGMYGSLFEVVEEKNKSAESLAELFQELERKGLVLMNMANDKGFLFFLSSGQMSNLNARRAGWKATCQALFIYCQARDVSTFLPESRISRTPLTPVPQDPVMPHLNIFIPAYQYALGKVRSNTLVNLSAGVEQQAHEYLNGPKHIQRVRLDYDNKLDDREKLFPAPRQRFQSEGYMKYIYSPDRYTIPVEKAKNLVEMFRCVPESSTTPGTTEAGEARGDPKLIQMNKIKEDKQKKVPVDTNSLKRKMKEEAQSVRGKSSRMATHSNGEAEEFQVERSCQSLADVMTSIDLQDTDLRKGHSKALKLVELLDKLSKTDQDTDLRMPCGMLDELPKTSRSSSLTNADGELVKSTEDTEKTLQDSMVSLGLYTNRDTDLRNQFVGDDDQETQRKTDLEEETAGSVSSLEAFSPCSESNGQHRGDNLPGERSIPWVLIPITGLKTERYSHRRYRNLEDPRFIQSPTVSTHTSPGTQDVMPSHQPDSSNMEAEPEVNSVEYQDIDVPDEQKVSDSQEQKRTPFSGVDGIVDEQISGFSTEVEDLLRGKRVYYVPYSGSQTPRNPPQIPIVPFSEYVSHFNSSFPVHSYINSFRDSVRAFLEPRKNSQDSTTLVSSSAPEVLPVASSKDDHEQQLHGMQTINGITQVEQRAGLGEWPESHQGEIANASISTQVVSGAGESTANSRETNNSAATTVESAPAAISDIVSQLQPEVINNLAKIMRNVQKNIDHFYIHCVDEESDVCWEIKDYLTKLGNPECDPQAFLEKKYSQDKLLIIIQNIDIAAHIHKIPALVSLKKLPSVSFAGVDSLDDIKNLTYNELFVSGGFIVSDELVLNPDFITQERLQALLHYLEELNTPESPWRWRVHCKTHKMVKEQSRCQSESMNILNLLTTYQKKQIVEFLSYHECDASSNQEPDLNCLVKLQAQNIRQRHLIYLTEHRSKMFPHFTNSGIVIANIDDILYSMASLIGEAGDKPATSGLQSSSISPMLREEDMGLLSSETHTIDRISTHDERPSVCTDMYSLTDVDPGVFNNATRDEMPIVTSQSPSTGTASELDFKALRDVITLFRNSRMQATSTDQPSPGTFSPNYSFLEQHNRPSSVPQGPLDHAGPSNQPASSFQASQGAAASQPLMEAVSQREQIHAETVSSSECVVVSHAQDKDCSGTREGMAEPDPVVVESTSNTGSDIKPTWNHMTDTVVAADPPINQNTNGNESGLYQKEASEQGTTQNPIPTTSSSSTKSAEIIVTSRKYGNRGGKRPAPRGSRYRRNAASTTDRRLQSGNLWPAQASQNRAMGFQSQLLNSSVANTFPHSGLRSLLPSTNMAWNNFTQGTGTNMWGIQPSNGLGQVHRTQFMQSYAWHGNPAFHGNGYPPPRGGYGGW